MGIEQPMIPGLEPPRPEDGELVQAQIATIEALREAGALQPWHRGVVAALIHAARDAERAHGIARQQANDLVTKILKDLPAPSIEETSDVVEYEGDRIARFVEEYERAAADPADVPDPSESAQV